jgi:hypothetical protein
VKGEGQLNISLFAVRSLHNFYDAESLYQTNIKFLLNFLKEILKSLCKILKNPRGFWSVPALVCPALAVACPAVAVVSAVLDFGFELIKNPRRRRGF